MLTRYHNRPALACLLLVLSVGCNKEVTPPAADAPAANSQGADAAVARAQEQPPASIVSTGLDPDPAYPIPELPPEQLLEYINQMALREPQGENEDAFRNDYVSITRSRLIAADRIIMSPGIDESLTEAAVVAKLDALRTLAFVDPQGLGVHFGPFTDELIVRGDRKLGLMAHVSRMQHEIDRLSDGRSEEPQALLTELDAVLTHPDSGYSEFLATQYAPVVLDSRGFSDKATEVLNRVATTFAKSPNAELAKEALRLQKLTTFREKVVAAMSGDKSEVRELLVGIRELLVDKESLTLATLDTTLNAAQMLEYSGKLDVARQVFSAIGKAFASHSDKQLVEQAKRSVEYAFKRIDLVGQQMEIEGVHIDGAPFQWKNHSGKVVLVDFWATWSLPWQNELANIRASYDRFHDDGFDVVGINLDEDRNQVYRFVRERGVPWTVIVDEVSGGFGNVNAIRYGVEAVPFVALVGRDGKVDSIHIRGADLTKRIQALLAAEDTSSRSARLDQEPAATK